MDMNKIFYLPKEKCARRWHLIDADGKIIGRLATQIADLLTGKGKVTYAPHTGDGDYVVFINVEKAVFSGSKMKDKEYIKFSGWMGGKSSLTAQQIAEKHPERLLEHAIRGMVPKNTLGEEAMKRVRLCVGPTNPHAAQL